MAAFTALGIGAAVGAGVALARRRAAKKKAEKAAAEAAQQTPVAEGPGVPTPPDAARAASESRRAADLAVTKRKRKAMGGGLRNLSTQARPGTGGQAVLRQTSLVGY